MTMVCIPPGWDHAVAVLEACNDDELLARTLLALMIDRPRLYQLILKTLSAKFQSKCLTDTGEEFSMNSTTTDSVEESTRQAIDGSLHPRIQNQNDEAQGQATPRHEGREDLRNNCNVQEGIVNESWHAPDKDQVTPRSLHQGNDANNQATPRCEGSEELQKQSCFDKVSASEHVQPAACGESQDQNTPRYRITYEQQVQQATGVSVAEQVQPLGSTSAEVESRWPPQIIRGVPYPRFFNESEISKLQTDWHASPGDVFLVAHFPIRGIQRLMVSLVEGCDNPWAPGLIDKPHFADAAASKRGAHTFMKEASTWQGRRLFKSHCMPHLFPCHYPFDQAAHEAGSIPPKIVVLVADPRHAFTMWYETFGMWSIQGDHKNIEDSDGSQLADCFAEFIKHAPQNLNVFGNYFDHAIAWAREAQKYPDSVKLFVADKLGSMDPLEVMEALTDMASFLKIPQERAERLAAAVFERPENATEALKHDTLPNPPDPGPLVEQYGRNLYLVEDVLSDMASQSQNQWRLSVSRWVESSNDHLVELAREVLRGMVSLPPLSLTMSLKGPEVHRAGQCRPCVFALRGVCKNTAEMCRYCHSDEHTKTKRASHRVRKLRKQQKEWRQRTPSPVSSWQGLVPVQSSFVPSTPVGMPIYLNPYVTYFG
eukprot:gnl/MRDRNA2_/MRDRNA2_91014_c0_seq1.p1 gnl/MRDRNA2_/MRDRNA2_91014_c0~~gnl/MRDRNA2_/MRDRNA2_91014_c0_seq1.p1  ORF type:complete len:654 (-),score=87.08 gnl/MRDRNA2_/MRDRNA2_91014_c0_seq1:219-2180(-)